MKSRKFEFIRHAGWRGNYKEKPSLDRMMVHFDKMGLSMVVDIPVANIGDRAEFELDRESAWDLVDAIKEVMGDRPEVQA